MWPVAVTFVAAMALDVVLLPNFLDPLRPPLPALILIYWTMMRPDRIGVGVGFLLGICLDILHGQLLGQNALALSCVAYLTWKFHLQIRIFPLWQLTMTVLALLVVGGLLQFLVEGIAGLVPAGIARWIQILSGTLVWPLLLGIMDRLRMQIEYRESTFN
jgi:rod shape-determining protein MreD